MNIFNYLSVLIILHKTQIYKYQETILPNMMQWVSRVVEANHRKYEEYAKNGLVYVLDYQQMEEFTQHSGLLKRLGEYYCMAGSVIRLFDNCKKEVNGLAVQEKMGYAHNAVSSFIAEVKKVCINGEKGKK